MIILAADNKNMDFQFFMNYYQVLDFDGEITIVMVKIVKYLYSILRKSKVEIFFSVMESPKDSVS